MIKITCPHCGASGSITPLPKQLIVVAPCPQCGELVVLFREQVVAMNRDILNHGTAEQKIRHIAEIITTFVESFGPLSSSLFREGATIEADAEPQDGIEFESADAGELDADEEESDNITRDEVRDFVNIDLKLIDRKEYFERVFGKLE